MGQTESKKSIIEINSKDLEENKVSLNDIIEKSKTNFLSLNIKQVNESKSKFKRKKRIEFEYFDSFIEKEEIEDSIKYLIKDIETYQMYFKDEFDRLNFLFHPKLILNEYNKEENEEENNEDYYKEMIKNRKEIDKFFFNKFESTHNFKHYPMYNFPDVVNNEGSNEKMKKTKSFKGNSKKHEFEQLNELEKLSSELEKEKLNLNEADFQSNLNLLIHKYENKSFDYCKQFFLSKK